MIENIKANIAGLSTVAALTEKHNRALSLTHARNFSGAMEAYREVLEGEIEVLGHDHIDTLTTRHNIATLHFRKKEYLAAEALLVELKGLATNIFGPENPFTFCVMASLAATLYVIGKREEALEMMEAVRDGRERVLGPDHPDTILEKNRIQQLTINENAAN